MRFCGLSLDLRSLATVGTQEVLILAAVGFQIRLNQTHGGRPRKPRRTDAALLSLCRHKQAFFGMPSGQAETDGYCFSLGILARYGKRFVSLQTIKNNAEPLFPQNKTS